MTSLEAVVFDLDGVLLDSEQVWDDARRGLTIERGGRWRQDATPGHDGDEFARVVFLQARGRQPPGLEGQVGDGSKIAIRTWSS